MSVDISGTSCDQCRSMVQYRFTSTETRRLVRTDSPGRPPRLSHSSWTMTYVSKKPASFIQTWWRQWSELNSRRTCKVAVISLLQKRSQPTEAFQDITWKCMCKVCSRVDEHAHWKMKLEWRWERRLGDGRIFCTHTHTRKSIVKSKLSTESMLKSRLIRWWNWNYPLNQWWNPDYELIR